jgi:enoyl-CoA hydratase/carnithine racemase
VAQPACPPAAYPLEQRENYFRYNPKRPYGTVNLVQSELLESQGYVCKNLPTILSRAAINPIEERQEMNQEVVTRQADGIFAIQMNRPEKKNAITQNMYALMAEGLRAADQDNATRVVVLHGSQNIFTSGNDIKDFQARATATEESGFSNSAAFFEAILSLRKPLIAAVQGYAIGIGTTMLLHCDLVYAGKNTIFSLPFVNLGLCPEFGSSYLLPQLAGHQRAAELFLLGERFSPEQARQVGIVNQVFDDAVLMDKVMEIARSLACKSPSALMATKKLMKGHGAQRVREAIKADGEVFGALVKGPEAQEAFAAFATKRAPDFSKF